MGMLDFFRWPVTVVIDEKRENGYFRKYDKAKRIKKDGVWYYKLKKLGITIKPQKFENIMTVGKNNFLMLYSPQTNVYYPYKIEEGTLKPIEENWDYFKAYADSETKFKYMREKGWEKWIPLLTIFVTALGCVMILYVSLPLIIEHLNGVTSGWVNAINQNTQAQQSILEALRGSIVNTPANSPPVY